jgi:hypothetical protein
VIFLLVTVLTGLTVLMPVITVCTAVPAWVTAWVTFLHVLVLLHGCQIFEV